MAISTIKAINKPRIDLIRPFNIIIVYDNYKLLVGI